MKHTPGPWKLCARGDYSDFDGDSAVITGDGDTRRLAVVHHDDTAEHQANAQLIAAAPELLASLKAVMSFWINVESGDEMPAEIFDAATTAIAKAEGTHE